MASASAKRPREEEEESKYPFTLALGTESHDIRAMLSALEARFPDSREKDSIPVEEQTTTTRWPYFFALPPDESAFSYRSDAVKNKLTLMPRSQQLFLECFTPDNMALLKLWKHMFATVFALRDRTEEHDILDTWSTNGYLGMRSVLSAHPWVGEMTDLVSMIPLVERELAQDILNHKKWRLYDIFFMPGPNRVGVALPVGLVLFEGRGNGADPTELLEKRVRREPFSTSWHMNVGIKFASSYLSVDDSVNAVSKRHACLFVHKIMSDGIVGVDMQQAREDDNSRGSGSGLRRKLSTWGECEIMIQPLVSIHLVDELIIGIENREAPIERHQYARRFPIIAQRVLFTHAFLGDTCPCEAHAAAESNKQQRLEGRMKLLIHQ